MVFVPLGGSLRPPYLRRTLWPDARQSMDEPNGAPRVAMVARLHHPMVDIHHAELSICPLVDDSAIFGLFDCINAGDIPVQC